MRILLLTSAGTDVKDEILKVLPKSPAQTKLAYITTASNIESDRTYVEKDRKNLEEMGFKVIELDIEGKTKDELWFTLMDFDCIFVQGGNTFYLLDKVRKSGFDLVVRDLLDRGLVYIGVSAGSVICGPTIETAGWKYSLPDVNTEKLEDLTALNLVPFNVLVHYEPRWREKVRLAAQSTKYPFKLLTDDQALLVKDEKIELVGSGEEVTL